MRLLCLLVFSFEAKRIVINTWPFVEANEAAWKERIFLRNVVSGSFR